MTEAIFDFAAINRRMNRKPEPVAAVAVGPAPNAETVAALESAERGEGTVLPSWWTMEGYRAEVDANAAIVAALEDRNLWSWAWSDFIVRDWDPVIPA